jgi:AcrR family transcriptional regulator
MAANASPSPFPSRDDRDRTREEKREAVLRAAVRMFNARGFHATSLDDVAASLGVSKPTIYHYLGNKEQVLIECVDRGLTLLREAAEGARDAHGNGRDRLRAFLIRYARINMEDFGRCTIRTGDEMLSAEGAARFRAGKRTIDRALRALIAEGVEDGSLAVDDVRLTAFTFAGALNWPARWYDPEGDEDPVALAEAMADLLLRSVTPAG